ncbi:helicase associated domain-containing protein, partial [Streptomyces sp. A1277]|uniref:helicase associated domain-containing protein n=1 Tax=Streptomyces sp. A1277 TaxID=2563103 RepID=UPI0019D0F02B
RDQLIKLGIQGATASSAAPATSRTARGPAKAGSKAQAAFQRGLAALALWVEQEGMDRPVPRSATVEITVNDQPEPVTIKLGVWLSNTRSRRDRLGADQLAALADLGVAWAGTPAAAGPGEALDHVPAP